MKLPYKAYLRCMMWLCGVGVVVGSYAQAATCADNVKRGINLAGAEFGNKIPGRLNWDYKFPRADQISYYKHVGFDVFRLPLKWERIQPVLNGPLDPGYTTALMHTLDLARDVGMGVVIDIHNYARFQGELIGSPAVPNEAFKNLWRRIAELVHAHPAIYAYGLMNEPYNTNGLWSAAAQFGLDGVREIDRTKRVYIAGDRFSSAKHWPRTNPMPFVVDPSGMEVYEAHAYFDVDDSGKYKDLIPYEDPKYAVASRLEPFTLWLRKYNKKGVIGEWGVPTSSTAWLPTVSALLHYAHSECIPTFVWAGGGWSTGYQLSLEPLNGVERPVLSHMRNWFNDNPIVIKN